jgi:predicted branched-subunit amino acid permease
MRHLYASHHFRAGFVEMLPACVGLVPFGIVCGVGAAAAGASWLTSLGMSAIIFSGAAQIVAAQMVAADAPFLVIVLTTTVLGLRLLMFMLSDQVFAAAIRRFHIDDDRIAAARHFLGSGFALWLAWQLSCMLGYFAGNLIPAAWSLEFAVPLCFIALVAPLFRDTPSILAAITAGIAVLALAHLPMRLNLIAAGLIGITIGTLADLARERWTRR